MKAQCVSLSAASLMFVVAVTIASPLKYDEFTDGDLPYLDPTETEILPFDLGNNSIEGSVTYTDAGSVLYQDLDTFGFTVPLDSSVQRIRLSFGPFPYSFARTIVLRDRSDGSFVDYFLWVMNSGDCCDSPNPSEPFAEYWNQLLPGHSYSVTIAGASWESPGGAVPYQWSFLITRVPEPGTLGLLSLGVFGLALIRRSAR